MERDADLLAALKAGDRHAVLEGLMERYRQKVMHLAVLHRAGLGAGRGPVADHFVKVWQALPKFDGRAAISTWLYTIARNTCLTAVARERRIVPLEDFAEVADDDGDPMVFGTAQAGVESAGQASAEYDVAKLLEQLPEPYRRVVVLFYLEDRSCEEVGELLSMPTGTVKALLHRGRKTTRRPRGRGAGDRTMNRKKVRNRSPARSFAARIRFARRNWIADSTPGLGAHRSAKRASCAAAARVAHSVPRAG